MRRGSKESIEPYDFVKAKTDSEKRETILLQLVAEVISMQPTATQAEIVAAILGIPTIDRKLPRRRGKLRLIK